MAGYSGTPLWKKLGVRPGSRLLLLGAPRGWSVADLPEEARTARGALDRESEAPAELMVAFFSSLGELREHMPQLARRIFPAGAIWVAWPRRAAGHVSDIREQDIRTIALPLGLVDVKVAALEEDWSGLKLVWRKDRRHASPAAPG